MRLTDLLIAAVMLVTAAWPRAVSACSCGGSDSPCGDFQYPVVFVGDVLSVQETGGRTLHRVRVVRALKGVDQDIVDVWSGGPCGTKLQAGERYVLYASQPGRIEISGCSPIRHVPAGEPEPELPPMPGRVYGRLIEAKADDRLMLSGEPVPAARVWIDLPGGRIETVSDAWGRFVLSGVPPGRRRIEVDAGPSLRPVAEASVTLTSSSDCRRVQVPLKVSGGLTGRVVSSEGTPVAKLEVYVVQGAHPVATDDSARVLRTDADGRFTVDGLPPGEYVLAVNLHGQILGHQPYPPTFFGGADAESATRLRVGVGRTDLGEPFVLPPPLPVRTFTVAVVCADGSTPRYVFVAAHGKAPPHAYESFDMVDGRYVLRLVRGLAYTIDVNAHVGVVSYADGGTEPRDEKLAPVDVTADEPGRAVLVRAPFTKCGTQDQR